MKMILAWARAAAFSMGALAVSAAAHAGVVLTSVDPTVLDTSVVSTNGTTPATIDFVNELATNVDVYWINYSGDRVFYEDLTAGSSYDQPTYITHPWIIALVGSGDTLAQGTGMLVDGFFAETPDAIGTGPDVAYIKGAFAPVSAAPEPSSWLLMFAGIGSIGLMLRQAKRTMGFDLKDVLSA